MGQQCLEMKLHGQGVSVAVHAKIDRLNKNLEALQERLAELEYGLRLDLPPWRRQSARMCTDNARDCLRYASRRRSAKPFACSSERSSPIPTAA